MLPASFWPTSLVLVLQGFSMPSPASAAPSTRNGESRYGPLARDGVNSLNQNWYSSSNGLWGDLWWNSGNALTTIADFAMASPTYSGQTDPRGIIENTFNRAQDAVVQTAKFINHNMGGMVESRYCINGQGHCASTGNGTLAKRGFQNFLNQFYDDEGWWALGLIRAYDFTRDQKYLDAAVKIYEDMGTGSGTKCGGGIYWSKDRKYVNAIANELYLAVGASLANRVPDGDRYQDAAQQQWDWFWDSGMINDDDLVNDGLDDGCKNNGQQTWSYNQGALLGGLVELYRASDDDANLEDATRIAKAAIRKLADQDDVLREAGGCETQPGRCGNDGQQFKGVFVRNLAYLHEVAPDPMFRDFIIANANSIWARDRDTSNNELGVAWAGPYFDATSASQSSALDALVAAIKVA